MHLKDFILILPYLNNREGLIKSLNSIEYPTDRYEIIIVDDGSRVPLTREDIALSTVKSGKVEILRADQNKGVAAALNRALEFIKDRTDFKYIARLDCGDLCVNERFSKQVEYLDNHPDVYLLGSKVIFRNPESGREYQYQNKTIESEIRREMHFKCSFIHPSVMFKREVLDQVGVYPENYLHCEDYAFFFQILRLKHVAILPEILLITEWSDQGVSSRNRKRQLLSRIKVVSRFATDPALKFGGLLRLILLILIPLPVIRFVNTRK